MRRTSVGPGWRLGGLLTGLLAVLSAGRTLAQEKVPLLVISVGTTKSVSMSNMQDIARVEIDNEKVCSATSDPKSAKVVYLTGLAAGTTRVTLTDTKKNVELLDVEVVENRLEQKKLFLKQIAETIPQAKVDVNISGKATVVTGTAPDAVSQKYIQQVAEAQFGKENLVFAVQLPERDRPEPTIIVPRVQQVQLEVQVAVVNRSEIRQLSFNWVDNNRQSFLASLIGTTSAQPLNFSNSLSTSITGAAMGAVGNPNLQFGVIGNRGSFSAYLEALRTEGLAKIMAEPRVTALSGQKAQILSGGEVPVVIATSVGAPPMVQYKPFGTSVVFTPVVLENGTIQLTVEAELSNRNDANSLNLPGVQAPGFDTRRASSVVHIEPGQTLAIGGLIQNTVNGIMKKVPVLGDIPFLGVAFSSTRFEEREEELIILVTPQLAHPLACNQLPRYLPGRETRVADDFELYLTQILEAPRGPREAMTHGHFRAAHKTGPTASIFPCADPTNGHGWYSRGSCAHGNCVSHGHATVGFPTGATRLGDAQGVPGHMLVPAPSGPTSTPPPAAAPSNLPEPPAALVPDNPPALPVPSPLPPSGLGTPDGVR
ncbi:MAG: pilus assembly protein N-terminal domain-containing protein [Gemmataceae bacterium]|nr:pilus assembly protein N-terminal domain-containing protein [Gemmataceae bacterium]